VRSADRGQECTDTVFWYLYSVDCFLYVYRKIKQEGKEEYRDRINLAYRKKAERNEEIKHNEGCERKSRDQAGKEGRGYTGKMKHKRKDMEV
jgi:hypothetical protein